MSVIQTHPPKLFLHIGLPKTGTTTIQHFLRINSAVLSRFGAIYPKAGRSYEAHHQIAMSLEGVPRDWVESSDLDTTLECLRSEVQQFGANKVILSSEIFTFVKNPGLIRETFQKDFELFVLIFLRRQDDWIESCYRQDLIVGDFDGPIEDYLAQRAHHLNFKCLVDFWDELVEPGHLQLHIPLKRGEPGSIQQEFLKLCNIPYDDSFEINNDANLSLSRDAIEFLRLSTESRRLSKYYQRLRSLLADYSKLYQDTPAYRRILSPAQRQMIWSSCLDGNRDIAARHCISAPRDLFEAPRSVELDSWREYNGLTSETASRIGHFLARHLIE